MKRTIILLCMLMAACPIKGADSSASGSQVRLGVTIEYEPLEVDSSDDKGKEEEETVCKVHLKRDGQEIVPPFAIALLDQCFAADLMKAAGGLVQDDKEAWIRSIFQDYTDEQIRLFVGALEHSSEDDASAWVNGLSNDDCISLIEIANCWDIKFIMQACQERLARDLTETDADALSGDVQYLLKDQLKQGLSDLNWHILKRLSFAHQDFLKRNLYILAVNIADGLDVADGIQSIYNERYSIIYTDRRALLYDFTTNSSKEIFTLDNNAAESIYIIKFSRDGNNLIIRTSIRTLWYDFTTNTYKEIFVDFGNWLAQFDDIGVILTERPRLCRVYDSREGTCAPLTLFDEDYRRSCNDNDRLLLPTDRRIRSYNIRTGVHNDIFVAGEKEYIHDMYNFDTRIYIVTNKRILLYDIEKGTCRDLFVAADNDSIKIDERSFTQGGKNVVIQIKSKNNNCVILYDASTYSYKKIYEGKRVDGILCAADESGVVITVDKTILFYDIAKELIHRVFVAGDYSSPTVHQVTREGILIRIVPWAVGGRDRILWYRFQGNKMQHILCADYDEKIYSAQYIHHEQALLVHTKRRIIIMQMPISSEQYEQLSLQQLQLLYKACSAWKLGKPYELAVSEMDLYKGLPKELKAWQLFSTYYVDINDNPMNPSMFMGDAIYGPSEGCQVM